MLDNQNLKGAATYNEQSLKTLIRSIALSKGQFSLIVVRCNYVSLQAIALQHLQDLPEVGLQTLSLPASATNLQSAIEKFFSQNPGQASPSCLAILGLETVATLDKLLQSANQLRDGFRRQYPFPILLWVNDDVLQQLIRFAPDFKSWAASAIKFEVAPELLLQFLQATVEQSIANALTAGNLTSVNAKAWVSPFHPSTQLEMELARRDLASQGHPLHPSLQADLEFLLGRNDYARDWLEAAFTHFQTSLEYLETEATSELPSSNLLERQGLVLLHLGLCCRRWADLEPTENMRHWKEAQTFFQKGIAALEQAQRQDLVAEWVLSLGEVLQKLKAWGKLQTLAEQSLFLHETYGIPVQRARDYGFLAEVALAQKNWSKAQQLTQQALKVLVQGNAYPLQDRGMLFFLLARSLRALGQSRRAIDALEQALQDSAPEYDPRLYIRILELLRSLYFEQRLYREAFRIKQDRRSIEQQYGFRAFVGAGPLQPQRQAVHPTSEPQPTPPQTLLQPGSVTIAQEIVAAGQLQDVNELMERIGRTDCKLTVLHGHSGVGKSSILNAGLIPALQQRTIGERYALPVAIRVYSHWPLTLGRALRDRMVAHQAETIDEKSLVNADEGNAEAILEQLRRNADNNFLTVLIFDQLEEFFFACVQRSERQQFYEFLNRCLNLPFVKVILSLREDYLHYLLECERLTHPGVVNNNILDKSIRHHIGNFSKLAAKRAIQRLTERAQFYLEPALIDRLVADLATEGDSIYPIELQVIGAQLQADRITTLDQYNRLGENPKSRLIQRLLENAIEDCGREHETIAWCVLSALTDERGTRPLKTPSELAGELKFPMAKLDLVLEILAGSGLIFLVRQESENNYQLVHDYLVAPIREKQDSGIRLQLARAEAAKRLSQNQLLRMRKWGLRVAIAFTAVALSLAIFAESQRRRATISEINARISALSSSSEVLFASDRQFDALIEALRAWKKLQQAGQAGADSHIRVVTALQQALYGVKERNRLEGHDDAVWGVSFSPDGTLLASASNDQTVKLWQTDGTLLRTLKGHRDRLTSVSFSPNGRLLVSSSSDKTAKIWTLGGNELATLNGHTDAVQSATFSPDGKTVLTGSLDGTARLWSLSGQEIQRFVGHEGAVSWVCFSPNGATIATAGEDGLVRLWNRQGELLQILRGHVNDVTAVTFHPNGQLLASAGRDRIIRLWRWDGIFLKALRGHEETIWNLAFSADGKTLASASGDTSVKLWDWQAGAVKETFNGHGDTATSVSFSPNDRLLASASLDKTIKLWSLETKSQVVLEGHRDRITQIRFSPDGKTLATSSHDKTVKLWNRDGKLLKTLEGHRDRINSVSFSPDGQQLVSGGRDRTLILWNRTGQKQKVIRRVIKGHKDSITSASFSPDGALIASTSKDKTVKLWDRDGNFLSTLSGHDGWVNAASFSPDGETLASASDDGTVKLWDRDGNLLKTLDAHDNWVVGVEFSPDGQILASAGWDNTVKLWDRQGNLLKVLLKGYGDSVNSVSFRPLNQERYARKGVRRNITHTLAAASWDGTVKLWSQDGQLLKVLKGHKYGVLSTSFSPDGKLLASASDDNTAILWNLDLEDLLRDSCNWLDDYFRTNPNAPGDSQLCKQTD